MPTGQIVTLKHVQPGHRSGRIERDGSGPQVPFHEDALRDVDFEDLKKHDRVQFDIQGGKATAVKRLES